MLDLISQDRLKSYKSILKTRTDQESLKAYYWNKALCGSIYPALQCLEVSLRNALDIAIKNRPPSGGLYVVDAWWFHNISEYMGDKVLKKTVRFDHTGKRIKSIWEEDQVKKVRKRLTQKGSAFGGASSVMAGLDFGFWTNLLSDKYEDTGSNTLLWPNLLTHVFPNAPLGTTRADIELKLNRIREFRNRISHHEPIWKFYYPKAGSHEPDYTRPVFGRSASIGLLAKEFEEIIEVASWISKDRADYLVRSQVCSAFKRLCSTTGLNAYLSPEKIQTIELSRASRIKPMAQRMRNGEIFSVTRKGKVIAILGADVPVLP